MNDYWLKARFFQDKIKKICYKHCVRVGSGIFSNGSDKKKIRKYEKKIRRN